MATESRNWDFEQESRNGDTSVRVAGPGWKDALMLHPRFTLIDAMSAIGFAFVIGWMANASYYNIQHLWQQNSQLTAAVHCEDRRADKASKVAGQAILSANIDAVPTPHFKDLPLDNCPHPPTK